MYLLLQVPAGGALLHPGGPDQVQERGEGAAGGGGGLQEAAPGGWPGGEVPQPPALLPGQALRGQAAAAVAGEWREFIILMRGITADLGF